MKASITRSPLLRTAARYKQLYILMLPGLLLLITFMYIPMFGVVIAFKDYTYAGGIFGSSWVGLKHFRAIFSDPYFYTILRNTLIISLINCCLIFLPR